MKIIVTLASVFMLGLTAKGQQAGTLDLTFANEGIFSKDMSNPEYTIRFQSSYRLFKLRDGSLLSFDFASIVGGMFNCNITKFTKNGRRDLSFGTSGATVLWGWLNYDIGIKAVWEGSDGTIYVVGMANNFSSKVGIISKSGKVLSWSPLFDSEKSANKIVVNGHVLASFLDSKDQLLLSTKDSVLRYSHDGFKDVNFKCKQANVFGIFDAGVPNKYLIFTAINKQMQVLIINDDGSEDNSFQKIDYAIDFEPSFEINSGTNFFSPNNGLASKKNDSTYAFIMVSNTNTIDYLARSFQVNIASKSISPIKQMRIGLYYIVDEERNTWVQDKKYSDISACWYRYDSQNTKIDTLKNLNGGLFIDHDTMWTSVNPFANNSAKLQYSKTVDGLPSVDFGNNGTIVHRVYFDYDVPLQSIKLKDSYLINTTSGGYYSSLYRLKFDGTLDSVGFNLKIPQNRSKLKISQLVQNGSDILLYNDSLFLKYDEVLNQFKEQSIVLSKPIMNAIKHTINYLPNQILIADQSSVTAVDYTTGALVSTFGDQGSIKLPINDYSNVVFNANAGLFVFLVNGDVYRYDANGQAISTFGNAGKKNYPNYQYIGKSTSGYILGKKLTDSTMTIKLLDQSAMELPTPAITLNTGKGLTFNFPFDRSSFMYINVVHVVSQSDGKYLFAVSLNSNLDQIIATSGSNFTTKLFRLNADFSIDPTFGTEGYTTLNGYAIKLDIVDNAAYVFTNTALPSFMDRINYSDNTVCKINLDMDVSAVDDKAYENQEGIYPNPTEGMLQVENGNNEMVDVYNMLGVRVTSMSLSKGSVDISALVAGVYFVKMGEHTYRVTKR